MSSWTKFVTEVYNRNHAKNPNYQFKQAMKDASKEKKSGKMSMSMPSKKMRKMGKSRKSRKAGRKSRKMRGGNLPELSPADFSG
jgi:ribosomal protein L13E